MHVLSVPPLAPVSSRSAARAKPDLLSSRCGEDTENVAGPSVCFHTGNDLVSFLKPFDGVCLLNKHLLRTIVSVICLQDCSAKDPRAKVFLHGKQSANEATNRGNEQSDEQMDEKRDKQKDEQRETSRGDEQGDEQKDEQREKRRDEQMDEQRDEQRDKQRDEERDEERDEMNRETTKGTRRTKRQRKGRSRRREVEWDEQRDETNKKTSKGTLGRRCKKTTNSTVILTRHTDKYGLARYINSTKSTRRAAMPPPPPLHRHRPPPPPPPPAFPTTHSLFPHRVHNLPREGESMKHFID